MVSPTILNTPFKVLDILLKTALTFLKVIIGRLGLTFHLGFSVFLLQDYSDKLQSKNEERKALHDLVQNLRKNVRSEEILADRDFHCLDVEWSDCEAKLKTRIDFLTSLLSNIEVQKIEQVTWELETRLEKLKSDFERHQMSGFLKDEKDVEAEMNYCKVRHVKGPGLEIRESC